MRLSNGSVHPPPTTPRPTLYYKLTCTVCEKMRYVKLGEGGMSDEIRCRFCHTLAFGAIRRECVQR